MKTAPGTRRSATPASPTRLRVAQRSAIFIGSTIAALSLLLAAALSGQDELPSAENRGAAHEAAERQLPRAMHSAMKQRPRVTVGLQDAQIVGSDNVALQAAVDYVAALGGGVVEIGEGAFLMRDSLHLRSFVTVRGTKGRTVLRKAPSACSALALDGDFGEEQVTLTNGEGVEVGSGLAVWDANATGFHVTVARITGKSGSTFSLDRSLNADYMVQNGAMAATVFPLVTGCNLEGARIENLIVEGNKDQNVALNGCRGAGIYLCRGFATVIQDCVVRNFNGDGISFQQSNDVAVIDCLSEGNSGLGIHPGSGSQRPVVRGCTSRKNGEDGLFLCWRVRHGLFEDNRIESNGRHGISIGHKDTDNLLRNNVVRLNRADGVLFRAESESMAPHRNRLENNCIVNNGAGTEAVGVHISGRTNDLVLKNNDIHDTRPMAAQTQTVGLLIDEGVGHIALEGNTIEGRTRIQDHRRRRSDQGLRDGGYRVSDPSPTANWPNGL